jgi:hypothetical protein
MKKLLNLFTLCFFTVTFFCNAQSLTQNKDELTQLLCQRWDIDFAKIGEMRIEQMPGAQDFDVVFYNDGSYEIIDTTSEANKGIWTYYPEKKFIQLEINGRKTLRVIDLYKNKMVCSSTPGTDGPPMDIEIHFKSMN